MTSSWIWWNFLKEKFDDITFAKLVRKGLVSIDSGNAPPPPPPDTKAYGANMGPTWGRQDPGKPHVGPMNLAISVCVKTTTNDNLYSNDNAVCIFVCRQAPLHKKKSEHFRATKIKVKKVFELPCKKKIKHSC